MEGPDLSHGASQDPVRSTAAGQGSTLDLSRRLSKRVFGVYPEVYCRHQFQNKRCCHPDLLIALLAETLDLKQAAGRGS